MNFVDVVVGGIPEPIGGVTNFIYRLASNNMTGEVVDLYPSKKKDIPKSFRGKFSQVNGRKSFYLYYFFIYFFSKKKIFFNFSSPKGLFLVLLLPKRGNKFYVVLHHGELCCNFLTLYFFRLLSGKLDRVYAITPTQKVFYEKIGIDDRVIFLRSTYLPPVEDDFCHGKSSLVHTNKKHLVFIASGYPSSIYNHDWCIKAIGGRNDAFLHIFMYGDGDKKEQFLNMELPVNVFFHWDTPSFDFMTALASSDYYLRPTSRDSFGIAVADALNMGAVSIASDVCKRYPGTVLFKNGDYEQFKRLIDEALGGRPLSLSANFESHNGFSPFCFEGETL
ncbi:glycosyltransferase [Marinobacter sp.]|uniref:glycosyltransferase n=1 Tax=Marinobacter sp. TaxID=50741 RepID=UPI0034A4696C